ncbi:hypothetical protein RB597_000436 [Gaeumannomyces tritici]
MDGQAQSLKNDLLNSPKWDLKTIGYKEFTSFVSSDDDFFALRRFDKTHCRTLLALQDEISILEKRLDAIDHRLSTEEAVYSNNGTFRADPCPERQAILADLTSRLGTYAP